MPDEQPIEGTVVEQPVAAPLPAVIPMGRRELINVDQAVEEWDRYQELTKRLLNESDYQTIGKRKFKKKSAWRKYAKAFNISCEVLTQEVQRTEDGYPLFARVVVRATEPSGRWQDADHECHVSEKCCPAALKANCSKESWRTHTCCKPGCDGRLHFSHPGDLPAIAFTRAKNRAISDLIGAGEVSAEEMTERPDNGETANPASYEGSRKAAEPEGAQQPGKARADLRKALTKKFGADEQAAFEFMKSVEEGAISGTMIDFSVITPDRCKEIIAIAEAPA
jgi:hypothetical protein